jgi:hypothetical protein
MILAGIPVGLWRDPAGIMDASNYDGLTEISTLDDWLGFERDVRLRREMIIDRQEAFLRRLDMPLDPDEIYRRFARLIVAGLAGIDPRSGNDQRAIRSGGILSPTAAKRVKRPVVLSKDVLVETKA